MTETYGYHDKARPLDDDDEVITIKGKRVT